MKYIKTIFYALALTTVLHACVESDDPIVPTQKLTGIDIENLDQTVDPATDFYRYANGGWMKRNPLPAAYSRYGAMQKLGEANNERIRSILDGLKKSIYAPGTTERKLSDLYALAMDMNRRNQDGVTPLILST